VVSNWCFVPLTDVYAYKTLHGARTAAIRKLQRGAELADEWQLRAGHVAPAGAATATLKLAQSAHI
jgi:hypothetical protein